MHLLVDADIVVFRFASAFEEVVSFGDVSTVIVDEEGACKELVKFIKYLHMLTGAEKATMCFTSANNYRYSVLPTYKHNRSGGEKPQLFGPLRDFMTNIYECKTKPTLEADDVMGIMCTLDPDSCIATIDKDLNQIPGLHYNWNRKLLYSVDKDDGDFYFYQQILSGDPGDGYHGVPGIGPVTAQKILKANAPEDWWPVIVETYGKAGLTEEDALQQARVARICRAEDYDFKKKKVILWSPKET